MDLYNQIFCRFQKCNQKVPTQEQQNRKKKKKTLWASRAALTNGPKKIRDAKAKM